MNRLTIIGNLTGDPAMRTTASGAQVADFTVAVNGRKDQAAQFFRVTAWNKTAEACYNWLRKGRKVCVVGPVSVSTYQARDGSTRASLEITANEVEFLSSKSDEQSGQAPQTEQTPEPTFTPVPDEDLPF